MDQLKNFLPLIIFVAAYVAYDIYVATAALMIAVTLQVGLYLLLKKPLSMELKLTFWVGMVMGSLTLFFQNELFIQWKTTIINWLMAGGLIATHFFGKSYGTELVLKSLLQQSAKKDQENEQEAKPAVSQPGPSTAALQPDPREREVWRVVNFLWIGSFIFSGGLNLVVAYNSSLDFWVTYKLVGGMAITSITVAITIFYLFKTGLMDEYAPPEAEQGSKQNTT